MPGRRSKSPSYLSDDSLFRDLTFLDVLAVLIVIGIIYFLYWAKDNLRFSAECPKCLATEFVKRKHRSFFAKKVVPFLRINKLNCSRCNVTYYQAFSEK